jgi:hypothetical protein
VENGVTWTQRERSQVLDGTETLMRLGLVRCTEFQLLVPNYDWSFGRRAASGFENVGLAFKHQFDPLPGGFELAVAAGLEFPSGASAVSGPGYNPFISPFCARFAITRGPGERPAAEYGKVSGFHIANAIEVPPSIAFVPVGDRHTPAGGTGDGPRRPNMPGRRHVDESFRKAIDLSSAGQIASPPHLSLGVSRLSENVWKIAHVHAICACAWTRRAAPAVVIRRKTGKTYPGSILLGPCMFARTSHSSIKRS